MRQRQTENTARGRNDDLVIELRAGSGFVGCFSRM